MQFHSVYLQKRQAGVSWRDFQRLWRSHGDFAASVPEFWSAVERYVQNDPVEDTSGLPGNTAEFDAVGELFYTSYEQWLGMRDVMWHQVAPDEKRVFAGPPPISVRGARTVHQEPTGSCKLFTFASFRPELELCEADTAIAQYAASAMECDGFGALLAGSTVTRARTHDPRTGMDQLAQTRSSRDLVFIHHFPDDDPARSAMRSADYARLECAQDKFLDWKSRTVLLCHGWVLKGRMG